jgi:hypothetical protein
MYFGSKQGINTIFVAKTNSFDLSPNTFDPSPNTNDFDSHSTVFPSICEATLFGIEKEQQWKERNI